ncbi:COMPASS-like H3K4 histone methylase component WDR5B [Grifola frondosa]|uniref:COMPASS-like H3K4 histone methylase component WDR5B n=1 Tax=Grifola frondosa TaxID=5627 RepID=A0A1C7MLP4_GRIFR|nr:COMPASS-like H3K4 histone methylase component WDR5B [Grifola frondosa]
MVAEHYSTAYVEKFTLTSHSASVNCVAFSPDGKYVASGGDDHALIIWSLADGSLIYRLLFQSPVECLLWHPDIADTVVVGCQSGSLFQINSKRHAIHIGVGGRICCLDYDITTRCLAIGIGQEVHSMHERALHQYVAAIKMPSPPKLNQDTSNLNQGSRAVGLHFHNKGENLIVSYLSHGIVCWHIEERLQLWTIVPPSDTPRIGSSALSPDGRHIVVYNMVDGLHSYLTGSFRKQTPGSHYKFDVRPQSKHVLQVAYLHGGQAVICGTTAGNVCIWDVESREYFQILSHNDDVIHAIDTCQHGRYSYIGAAAAEKGQGTYVKIWRATSSRVHRDNDLGDVVVDALNAIAFTPLFRQKKRVGGLIVVFSIATAFVVIMCGAFAKGTSISWGAVVRFVVRLLLRLWFVLRTFGGELLSVVAGIHREMVGIEGRVREWILERVRAELRQFLQI